MAKYTMLFAEYLSEKDGDKLPSTFALIDGLQELFIAKYCDYELGFETTTLFELKLNYYADLYIPIYAERIRIRTEYWTKASNPIKVRYEKSTTQTNIGEQKTSSIELPINAIDATPSMINKNDAFSNNDEVERRNEESGETIDELMRVIDFLNKDVNDLIMKLLDEFKNLFMAVY